MTTSESIRIAVLEGDGIGPEIMSAAVSVLEVAAERTGLSLDLAYGLVGFKAYEAQRTTLPDETLELLASCPGFIVGPCFAGEYPADDPIRGHPSGAIRRRFGLFANIRPVEAWPALRPLLPGMKITILRENTEGFYPDRNLAWGYGEFKPTDDVAISLRVITTGACERFARFCFEYATSIGCDRLAVAHKRTALPQTEGLVISAFEKANQSSPHVHLEILRIDTFSSSFPRDPNRFPLVATTNLFGDIISDQASGLAGGVGMAPSLNAGLKHAMAQASHGTAPDIAGHGVANPSALILSTAHLMHWFFQSTGNKACQRTSVMMLQAIRLAIERGTATPDLGGTAGTHEFAAAVIDEIAKLDA